MAAKGDLPRVRRPLPVDPDRTQIDKFKEAARELGCDESEEAFDAALRKVAKPDRKPVDNAETKESKE